MQAEKIIEVAKEIGVPECITKEDLLQGSQQLTFMFAQHFALFQMQKPKPNELFLVNFVKEQTGVTGNV